MHRWPAWRIPASPTDPRASERDRRCRRPGRRCAEAQQPVAEGASSSLTAIQAPGTCASRMMSRGQALRGMAPATTSASCACPRSALPPCPPDGRARSGARTSLLRAIRGSRQRPFVPLVEPLAQGAARVGSIRMSSGPRAEEIPDPDRRAAARRRPGRRARVDLTDADLVEHRAGVAEVAVARWRIRPTAGRAASRAAGPDRCHHRAPASSSVSACRRRPACRRGSPCPAPPRQGRRSRRSTVWWTNSVISASSSRRQGTPSHRVPCRHGGLLQAPKEHQLGPARA